MSSLEDANTFILIIWWLVKSRKFRISEVGYPILMRGLLLPVSLSFHPSVCVAISMSVETLSLSLSHILKYLAIIVSLRLNSAKGQTERSLERAMVSPDGKWIFVLGKSGSVLMVDSATKQCVDVMKMNCGATCAAACPSTNTLYTAGGENSVFL